MHQSPDKREFKSFDGARLIYYDHGEDLDEEAPPVIMLHGLMSGGRDLDSHATRLKEHGLHAYALDLRAHGQSDGPKDPAAYRDQAMARDVLALGEHLGLKEYALFAYGLGCELTARVANLGGPVTRAVMCGWGGPPANQLDLYASDEWAAQALCLASGFEMDDPDAIVDKMAQQWRMHADNKGLDRFALAAKLRSGDSSEPGLDPRTIPFPVLVICGADDSNPHEFAAALPNAKGFVVEGNHLTAGRAAGLAEAAAIFLATK